MPEPLSQLLPRTMVVVAHQDDEAAGCGALMQRMQDPLLVFVTNGAPQDEFFWQRYGSREEYARIRSDEARRAAGVAGVSRVEFLNFDDLAVYRGLPQAFAGLQRLVSGYRPQAIVTLAYEGGHPDHDCCAFLCSWLHQSSGVPVWEFPLYSRPNGVPAIQRFLRDEHDEVVLDVSAEELARKQVMFATYASQGIVLSQFDLAVERFRRQAPYDFSRPPHEGELNYEAWKWPVKGSDLCIAFSAPPQAA